MSGPDFNTPIDTSISTTAFDKRRIEAICDKIPPDAKTILDVGCVRHNQSRRAFGNLHAQLHVDFPESQIVGIDMDSPETERMQSPGYDIRRMDCQEMALDTTFDVIVAGEVIEHLPRPGQFLKRAEEHLHPDGKLIVSTPNPGAATYFAIAAVDNWTSDDHTCWIDPQQLQTMVERSTQSVGVSAAEFLEPPGTVSRLLYKIGRERIGSGTYVAVIE